MFSRITVSVAFLVASFIAVTASGPPYDFCQRAYDRCDFRFARFQKVPTFDITGPDNSPFTTQIVSRDPNEKLGVLNSNGASPEFVFKRGAKRITGAGSPRFATYFYKPFRFRKTRRSGIGHQTYQGNQLGVALGKCIRVFFTSYELLERNDEGKFVVSSVVNLPTTDRHKCVVFIGSDE